jgi:hypothetical protein
MKRATALFIVLASIVLCVVGASANGSDRKGAGVIEIDYIGGTDRGPTVTGKVGSNKKACWDGRRVKVKHQGRLVAKGRTQGVVFSLDFPSHSPAGRYVATLKATDDCKGARSEPYQFDGF